MHINKNSMLKVRWECIKSRYRSSIVLESVSEIWNYTFSWIGSKNKLLNWKLRVCRFMISFSTLILQLIWKSWVTNESRKWSTKVMNDQRSHKWSTKVISDQQKSWMINNHECSTASVLREPQIESIMYWTDEMNLVCKVVVKIISQIV